MESGGHTFLWEPRNQSLGSKGERLREQLVHLSGTVGSSCSAPAFLSSDFHPAFCLPGRWSCSCASLTPTTVLAPHKPRRNGDCKHPPPSLKSKMILKPGDSSCQLCVCVSLVEQNVLWIFLLVGSLLWV